MRSGPEHKQTNAQEPGPGRGMNIQADQPKEAKQRKGASNELNVKAIDEDDQYIRAIACKCCWQS